MARAARLSPDTRVVWYAGALDDAAATGELPPAPRNETRSVDRVWRRAGVAPRPGRAPHRAAARGIRTGAGMDGAGVRRDAPRRALFAGGALALPPSTRG